jgi:hypothetical protein
LYQKIPGSKFCLAPTNRNEVSGGLTTFFRLNNRTTLQNHNRSSNLPALISSHKLLLLKHCGYITESIRHLRGVSWPILSGF